jgi:hypothetical protein
MPLRITAPAARSCGRRSTWNRRRRASSGQRPALSGACRASIGRARARAGRCRPSLGTEGPIGQPAGLGRRRRAQDAARDGPLRRHSAVRRVRWPFHVKHEAARTAGLTPSALCARRGASACAARRMSSPSDPGTSPPRGPRALRTGAWSAPRPVAGHPSSSSPSPASRETDKVTDQLALTDSGTNDIRGGPSCLSSVYSIGRVPAVPADAAQSGCRFTEERPP